MSKPAKVIIAGGGPCGLGAAWWFELWNRANPSNVQEYQIIDENAAAGGWARSVVTPEGFTFDFGGHVIFPHPHELVDFENLIEGLVSRWSRSVPIRGALMNGRVIPAPIQRNVHKLPAKIFAEILLGRIARNFGFGARRNCRPDDLRSYLIDQFGRGMETRVLGPLNRKMWAADTDQIDSCWVSYRSGSRLPNVPDVTVRTLLANAFLGRDDVGWTPETRVSYPQSGGNGAIWEAVARSLSPGRFFGETRVVGIDSRARQVELHDGRRVEYGFLISTVPLDHLLRMIVDRPDLRLSAHRFRYSSCVLVGFGIRGEQPKWLEGFHGLSVLEKTVPFWRVTLPGNISAGNVPDRNHWSVLCETSVGLDAPTSDAQQFIEQTYSGLIRLGILPKRDPIVSVWSTHLEHGYPTPFLGRNAVLADVLPRLGALGILSRGRFGAWSYEHSNQDQAFLQGVEAANFVLHGTPEKLIPYSPERSE